MSKKSNLPIDLEFAIQGVIGNDFFKLALNIDPFHIASFDEITSTYSAIDYISKFIHELNVSVNDFNLFIDRTSIIPGDAFGISSAKTNSFNSTNSIPHFLTNFKCSFYSHNISFFNLQDNAIINADFLFNFDNFNIGFDLLTDINFYGNEQTVFNPQFYLGTNFINRNDILLSLELTTALTFDDNYSGWGLSLSMPFSCKDLYLNLGAAYTKGDLIFGKYLNGYITNRPSGNNLTLFLNTILDFDFISLVFDLQLPFNLNNYKFNNNDFISLELHTSFWGLNFETGFRTMGMFSSLNTSFDNSNIFVTLGYRNDALSTKIKLAFNENFIPELTLSTTLYTLNSILLDDTKKNNLASFSLTTGYSKFDGNSFILHPKLKIGKDNYFTIKIPLSLSIINNKLTTASSKFDNNFDFGANKNNTTELVFDIFTDLFSFIDSMRFGNPDDSLYLIAERDFYYNNILFHDFISFNARSTLCLNTGFNINDETGFNLFVDNLELPRILSLSLNINPIGKIGPTISLNIANEIKFNKDNVDTLIVPSIEIKASYLKNKLNTSLFFTTFFSVLDGKFNQYFLNTESEFVLGFNIDYTNESFSIPISIGINQGRMRLHPFNAFSFMNFSSLLDNEKIKNLDMYFSLDFDYYENEYLTVQANYQIYNLLTLNERILDQFNIGLQANINDFKIKLSFIKNNFISSFFNLTNFDDYFYNKDTIFAISFSKDFEALTWYLNFSTSPNYQQDLNYINILKPTSDWNFTFTVMTSLRF